MHSSIPFHIFHSALTMNAPAGKAGANGRATWVGGHLEQEQRSAAILARSALVHAAVSAFPRTVVQTFDTRFRSYYCPRDIAKLIYCESKCFWIFIHLEIHTCSVYQGRWFVFFFFFCLAVVFMSIYLFLEGQHAILFFGFLGRSCSCIYLEAIITLLCKTVS